ncbi:MAG: 1-acyl-sn-glycerol-3-phosphate acyltransferase [Puniceicoccales bacterium]|nr:1-acyl-sn-glycerol-3-phosphate acyltransferase [Puniceicoccales bacterium]
MLVHPVYRVVVFVAKMMFRELFDGNIYGDENIPRRGPCLLACNHLSFFDPPSIGSAVSNREVFSLARSSLFGTRLRNWLFSHMNCIPVPRDGVGFTAIKAALNLLGEGKCVMIYPEGTRSLDGSTGDPHGGVGMLACKTMAPVVPCRIFGMFEIMGRSNRFFDWNRGANIVFGAPLLASDYIVSGSARDKYKLASQKIMDSVRNLQIPERRGAKRRKRR